MKFSRAFSSPSCLSAVVPARSGTRHPLAVSAPQGLRRRLSLCSPASLETYRSEPWELALRCPVALTARPGRLRAEEILPIYVLYRVTRRRGFLFLLLRTLFGADPRPASTLRASVLRPASPGPDCLAVPFSLLRERCA